MPSRPSASPDGGTGYQQMLVETMSQAGTVVVHRNTLLEPADLPEQCLRRRQAGGGEDRAVLCRGGPHLPPCGAGIGSPSVGLGERTAAHVHDSARIGPRPAVTAVAAARDGNPEPYPPEQVPHLGPRRSCQSRDAH